MLDCISRAVPLLFIRLLLNSTDRSPRPRGEELRVPTLPRYGTAGFVLPNILTQTTKGLKAIYHT